MYNDGQYLNNNSTWHEEDSPWKAEQILKVFNKNKIQPEKICEIGCGTGEILSQLYNKMPENVHFTGYEISSDAYELCNNKKKDRLKFHLADFLEESTSAFEVLLMIDIIEHIENYIDFLKRVKNRAKYKIFNVPLEIYAIKALFGHLYSVSRSKYGHIHYFNKEIFLEAVWLKMKQNP